MLKERAPLILLNIQIDFFFQIFYLLFRIDVGRKLDEKAPTKFDKIIGEFFYQYSNHTEKRVDFIDFSPSPFNKSSYVRGNFMRVRKKKPLIITFKCK